MQKLQPYVTRRNFVILILFLSALLLLTATRPSQAGAPETPTDYFICSPQQVGTFYNRVHVRCVPSAPNNISYFAVCSSTNTNFASRALSVFTTAKVTGKSIAIYYDPNDTSGTSCGCSSSDCRVIYGAEVMP